MTFVLLDERQDSINDGHFVTEMDGYPDPQRTKIVDYPASYHGGAAGFLLGTVTGNSQMERRSHHAADQARSDACAERP
jgi:hypothetical protein